MAHGTMKGGGEQEADAGFIQRDALLPHRSHQIHAQDGKHIRRPRPRTERAVPMLGDFQPRASEHERRSRGYVPGVLAISAGTAGVDHVVIVRKWKGGRAHGASKGGDLLDRFAAHSQGRESSGNLSRGRFTPKARREEIAGLRCIQALTVDQSGQ